MCTVGDGASDGRPYGPSTMTVGAGVLDGSWFNSGAYVGDCWPVGFGEYEEMLGGRLEGFAGGRGVVAPVT